MLNFNSNAFRSAFFQMLEDSEDAECRGNGKYDS